MTTRYYVTMILVLTVLVLFAVLTAISTEIIIAGKSRNGVILQTEVR